MGPGRRATIRLGTVRGVPVAVTPSVPVLIAVIVFVLSVSVLPQVADGYPSLYYVTSAALAALLFFVGLLAHELGHGLAARRCGVTVRSVTLWALGGHTELADEPRTPRAAFGIAAAGPITSALVAGACLLLGWALRGTGGGNLTSDVVLAVGLFNLALAGLNLLPGAPLDGGRMLQAVVWARTGDRSGAAVTAARSGRVVGMVLMLAGMVDILFGANLGGLWVLLAGWFLMTAASVEWQRTRLAVAMQGVCVRDVMGPPPAVGSGRLTVEEFLADVVLPSGKRVFAVLSFDRRLDGIVTLPMLQLMPGAQRAERRVSEVRIPMARVPVVAPDEPASVLLERVADRPGVGVILVVDPRPRDSVVGLDDDPASVGLVGLITAHELAHAMTVAPLRRQADSAARRARAGAGPPEPDGNERGSGDGATPAGQGGTDGAAGQPPQSVGGPPWV